MSARLTVQETADFLRTLDEVLILTHVRPDGDTVGCAAALCRALRLFVICVHFISHIFIQYFDAIKRTKKAD